MSANLYDVESLLIGKLYNSKTLSGEIVSAEKRNDSVWYDNAQAYLVSIRSNRGGYQYRTIAVSNN